MALLEVQDLRRQFGGLRAIDGVDATIEEGEIVGLIGPNGAGKTTFVNLLTGELAPTTGRVLYRGRDISRLPPYRRSRLGLARTFQVPRPFGSMTIRQNIAFAALFGKEGRPRDAASIGRKVDEVLDLTGFRSLAEEQTVTLSTAGLKRLEVARCLAAEPDLLFLDEPLGGLNQAETQDAIALIRMLNGRGLTICFIEHIIKAVSAVSHRIIVLSEGRKLAEGTPRAVLEDPAVRQVYLGDVARAMRRRGVQARPAGPTEVAS